MTNAKRTKYQRFEAIEVHRSEIKNAPYNPRKIKDSASKRLKKNLKENGLLSTLVWNKQTGNLVSGHQRLSQLDALEKSGDYTLTVAVVDLDKKTEREQNIFFNSTTAQGYFDFDLLIDVLDSGIDPFAAGLDENDLNIIGFDYEGINSEPTESRDAKHDMRRFLSDEGEQEDDEADEAEDYEARKAAVKAKKAELKELHESRVDEGESYFTVSFKSYKAKAAFLQRIGIDPDKVFVSDADFLRAIKNL